MLKNPPILILDEATSAVDNETEAAIQRSLEKIARGRTMILIAHRLSTIRNADRIYVLEHGRLKEQGKHEELLQQPGIYKGLWNVQTGSRARARCRATSVSTQPRPTRRAPVAGVNGTDIHEDMPTQEREWRVQRAGWAFMAAIVVAALVGLLGNGPLNERTLTSANGGLQVTYQRFRRLQTPGTLNLKVTPQPGAGQVQVSLNDAYLDAVYVQSVTPEPASVAGGRYARRLYLCAAAGSPNPGRHGAFSAATVWRFARRIRSGRPKSRLHPNRVP